MFILLGDAHKYSYTTEAGKVSHWWWYDETSAALSSSLWCCVDSHSLHVHLQHSI
jgi:hypothetical protein